MEALKRGMSAAIEDTQWTEREIRAQMERILGNPEFRATDRMRDFLRFVVEETLAGRARQLKGFTIATEVFGRNEDFDAAHDPVVRIQAGRLRRALERYYLVAGGSDPIHIDIPKGAYVPRFGAGPAGSGEPQAPKPGYAGAASWPSVVVQPFEDLTGRDDFSYLARGLATDLGIELSTTGDLRVMLYNEAFSPMRAEEANPDFVVCGSIRADGGTVKLVVQLLLAPTGELLWTDTLKAEPHDGELIAFQERTAAAIAAHIAGRHGVIFRAVSGSEAGLAIGRRGSYAAILKAYDYQQSFDPVSYRLAFEALGEARQADERSGLVCSMLALLYVDNLTLEFFDRERTPLAEALRLALQGVQHEPDNAMCRLVLARAHLLADDLEAGLEAVAAAQALHPESILYLDVIGYLRVLLGDWTRGERLLRQAIELNPLYTVVTRYALWLCALRRGDHEAALAETAWLRGVGHFWDPLVRAVSLGLLGRREASRAAVAELLALKPDFPERGRVLIGHLVKSPELRRNIARGLAVGGLALEAEAA